MQDIDLLILFIHNGPLFTALWTSCTLSENVEVTQPYLINYFVTNNVCTELFKIELWEHGMTGNTIFYKHIIVTSQSVCLKLTECVLKQFRQARLGGHRSKCEFCPIENHKQVM